jgi:hypothetical protein
LRGAPGGGAGAKDFGIGASSAPAGGVMPGSPMAQDLA